MQVPHLRGSGRRAVLLYVRAIDGQLSVTHGGCAGPCRRPYRHGLDGPMGKSFYIVCLRPADIGTSSTPVDVVDDGDIIDHCCISNVPDIVVTDIDAGDAIPGTKVPIGCRRSVSAV